MSEEQERVVIRDNRKIDRDAGESTVGPDGKSTVGPDGKSTVGPNGKSTVGPAGGVGGGGDDAVVGSADAAASLADSSAEPVLEAQVPMVEAALLDERTADLQRLQAEYANYRKRTERDRLLAGDSAVARVLTDLLPVVDDLQRAAAHGDLTGPLKAVADKLEAVTAKLGLVQFGVVGDPFDPSIHEAVAHGESDDVTVATCTTVMRPGYKHNERLLRPAMVAVSDPSSAADDGAGVADDQLDGEDATRS